MSLHHYSGPSKLKHIATCPGFSQRQNTDNALAERGTLQHLAFEKRDLSILPEDDMKQAVTKCIELADKITAGADEIHKEVLLNICGDRSFGTSDVVSIHTNRRHANVIDEKYGWLPVDPCESNWQVWDYVSAVFDRWAFVDTVTAWLLIPYQNIVDRHTFHRSEVDAIKAKTLSARVRHDQYRATKDPSMLRRSTSTCQYCDLIGVCAATREVAVANVMKYEPLEVLADVHSSELTDPVRMAKMLEAAPILEKMAESIRHHSKQLALELGGLRDANGEVIYEIASREAPRKLDKSKLCDAVDILRKHGITDGELLSVSDISISQASKIISDRAPKGKKKATLGALETELYDANVYMQGEPTITLKKVKNKD